MQHRLAHDADKGECHFELTYEGLKVNTKLECQVPEVFPSVDVAKQNHVVLGRLHELHEAVHAETVRNETL